MAKANYTSFPTLSIMLQAGSWTHVRKLLDDISKMQINYYALANSRLLAGEELDTFNALAQGAELDGMCLLDLLAYVQSAKTTLESLSSDDRLKPYLEPFAKTAANYPLPAFLQNILNKLMQCQTDTGYFLFMTDKGMLPAQHLRFKDKDTLVDFAENTGMTGSVFKHMDTILPKAPKPEGKPSAETSDTAAETDAAKAT